MTSVPTTTLPDDATLVSLLTDALNGSHHPHGPVEIVSRTESLEGTFRKEVIECRTGTNRTLRIFCKYDGRHPGSIAGEADGGRGDRRLVVRTERAGARTPRRNAGRTFLDPT